ncbi:cysteine-rich receptor-like protein kinase 26 isoform X2 [Humulus lupulus]|nr:cysteine-rich receptor-like protein kinase 26 isoform X2 [Humulus lupulus]
MATMRSLLFPLLCSLFILVAQRATAQTICFNEKGNFTLNSTYHDNLNHVLSNLLNSQNHNGDGFYNFSYGSASNQVFAIGACQGDVTIEVCRSCLNETMHIVREACPNQKEVIQWADKCMLRYSNRSLFGLMETSPNKILYKTANVPSDSVVAYFDVLMNLTNNLKSRAAAGGSLRKFAAASVQSPILFKTIYGLVMCTPDLSQNDCINCLENAIGTFPGSEFRTFGGIILVPSCKFRYEDYIFYNPTAEEAPPPSPLPKPQTASPPPPLMIEPGTKNNTSSARTIVIIVVSSTAFVGLIISLVIIMSFVQVNHRSKEPAVEETTTVESLQYSFETMKLATDNFSEKNKLGEGGFGIVYKGRLSNGQNIAVKKLSRRTAQGDLEFKNEVMLVAKLQHRNLVRLLGFSLEGSEKLLVYEFAQNGSLDPFIFDPKKRTNLYWNRRYKIIGGVARGLLYLHEDSRLRIIHRDLKASNILLDGDMHPKIADFGTARLFVVDQTQDNTKRIVGT